MYNQGIEHTILGQDNVSKAFRVYEDAKYKYDAAADVVREILRVLEQLEGKGP